MFLGKFILQPDEKNRVVIPAKFRRELGEKVILIKGFDECLCVYPEREFDELNTKLEELPEEIPENRRLKRIRRAYATEIQLDNQGRISIPKPLREFISLQAPVIITGQGKYLEIWRKERWDEYVKEEETVKVSEEAKVAEEKRLSLSIF